MSAAIDKLRKRISDHHATLDKLRAIYAADGHIDAKERKHLDALMAQVASLDAALAAKLSPGGAPGASGFSEEPQYSEDPMMSSSPEEEDEILMSSEDDGQGVITLEEVEITGTIEPETPPAPKEKNWADEFAEDMKVDELAQGFQDAIDKIANPQDITDFQEGQVEMVEETGQMMINAGEALKNIEDIGEDVEKQSQKNGELQEMIGEVTGEIAEMFAETTGEIAGGPVKGVGEVIEGLGAAADEGYEGVDEVLDGNVVEGSKKIYDGATGIAESSIEGVGDVSKSLLGGLYEAAEGAVEINMAMQDGILENLGIIDDDEDDND